MTKQPGPPFWQTKSLQQMNQAEWEALCDGCGRCCLNKLEDEDTGEIYFTNVSCQLLNTNTCRCQNYGKRERLMPDCLILSADKPEVFEIMPSTCAYRLLSLGKPLPDWHPLVSGDPDSVATAGISVAGKVVSEEFIHRKQLVEHIITWITTR